MKKNARHTMLEAQREHASAAPTKLDMKAKDTLSGPSTKGRRVSVETQSGSATSTPAIRRLEPINSMPGSPLASTVEAIRAHHRERRFAMGIQQVLDRKLESFIRINKTDWHVDDDEAARAKANKEVAAKIKAAREGEGDDSIIMVVGLTDKARAPADAERLRHENEMETLARSLPVAPWVETVPGLGYLGLATIIAETGDLSMYSNVAKVWKRLGYAPYDGLAGSSWKRPSWRNGREALTAEQWTENPFSGRRYALIHTISVWLKNKQWIGAAKTDDGVGRPNGKYGEVYAMRRAHTEITHSDWSKQHAHMDALRVMMKEVLKDLYLEWNPEKKAVSRPAADEAQSLIATTASPATDRAKPKVALPGSPSQNGRQRSCEAHDGIATASPAKFTLKPSCAVPGSPLHENGRHHLDEAHEQDATAEPGQRSVDAQKRSAGLKAVATNRLKPRTRARPSSPATIVAKPLSDLPGSPIPKSVATSRLKPCRPVRPTSPANLPLNPTVAMPGSPSGRQLVVEAQRYYATASPASLALTPIDAVPGSPSRHPITNTVATINAKEASA
jgi:hypothetical protein